MPETPDNSDSLDADSPGPLAAPPGSEDSSSDTGASADSAAVHPDARAADLPDGEIGTDGSFTDETDSKRTGGKNTGADDDQRKRAERKHDVFGASTLGALLPARTLRKTKEVFIPWPSLDEKCSHLTTHDRRIVVIGGEPNTGRFTAAVWIAQKLLKNDINPRLVAVNHAVVSGPELIERIKSDRSERDTAYIIRDPFHNGAIGGWQRNEMLQDIGTKLIAINSWLIFTALPADLESLGGGDVIESVSVPPFTPEMLKAAFAGHIAWLSAREPGWSLGTSEFASRIAETSQGLFGRELLTAPQIARFLAKLPLLLVPGDSLDDQDGLVKSLKGLANEISRGLTQVWFAQLSANAQFLALLVEAFQGIQRSDVEDLYCEEANRLRNESRLLDDPRGFGFDELYRQINVQIVTELIDTDGQTTVELQRLEFTHSSYRREILRQMRSRHHLLWGVVESAQSRWLGTIIQPWQAPQRRNLGEVVARLGHHRTRDLRSVMERLAADDSGIIASVPGYILRGICLLDEPDYSFILTLLKEWLSQSKYRWAAMAAIWRVYAEVGLKKNNAFDSCGNRTWFLERLERLVTSVAEEPLKDEEEVISYTVERMFFTEPFRVGRMVQAWLKGNIHTTESGGQVALRLFRAAGEISQLQESYVDALLELIRPVLRLNELDGEHSLKRMLDEILRVVLLWTERREWCERIFRSLLMTCNLASGQERERLCRRLVTFWLRSRNPNARRIARALICRARLMDGVPVELPGAGCAALVIDASEAGRRNDTSVRVAGEMHHYLRPQTDLWMAELGSSKSLCRPGDTFNGEQMLTRTPGPRILLPWIERLRSESNAGGCAPLEFVLVVHWKALVDADDIPEIADLPVVCLAVPDHHLDEDSSLRPDLDTADGGILLLALLMQQSWRMHSRDANEKLSLKLLSSADWASSICLSRVLAGRTADIWWKLLLQSPGVPFERRMAVAEEALREFEGSLTGLPITFETSISDTEESSGGPEQRAPRPNDAGGEAELADPLRTAFGWVQWMVAHDLPLAVQFLCRHMDRQPRGAGNAFAVASATMLLRTHFAHMVLLPCLPGSPAPNVHRFLPLVELAPALARNHSAQGVSVVLQALRCWLSAPPWAQALPRHPALSRMIECSPRWLCEEIVVTLKDWTSEPLGMLGEECVSPAVRALRVRLEFALSMRGVPVNDRVVLIVWHSEAASPSRLTGIVSLLFTRIEAQRVRTERIPSFLFIRAGDRHPAAVSGESGLPHETENRTSPQTVFMPVYERMASRAELVIFLTDAPPIDSEDWTSAQSGVPLKLFWDNAKSPPQGHDAGWKPIWKCTEPGAAADSVWETLISHFSTLAP